MGNDMLFPQSHDKQQNNLRQKHVFSKFTKWLHI